jgi:MFS family permease
MTGNDDHSLESTAPDVRQVLRRMLVAWLFGAAWQSLTTGATLTRYARSLRLDEFGFGWLAAVPFLTAFAQLPAALLVQRFGRRKSCFLAGNLIHRSLWLVIAVIPWLLPEDRRPAGLVTLMLVSALANHVTAPAWYSWLTDLVPARIRGRYFSRRIQAGQLVSLVLTIGVGLALDWAEGVSGLALARMLSGLLTVAAVCGLVDILYFLRVPDAGPRVPDRRYGVRELFVEPLRDRSFRRYLLSTAALTFSTGYVAQFSWLYMFDVVKVTNTQANLMMITGPQLVALLSLPFWGRMIDRLGRKPVALIATALVVPGGAVWTLVQPGHIFPGYFGVAIAAFAWPGVELAGYNILLGLVRKRPGGGQNTAYVAVNSVVVATAGTISGLFGGLLAGSLKHWKGDLWGLPLTYHGILFLLSAVFRLLALWSLRGIEDPRAFRTREALRHMTAEMYSNLQATVMTPVRLAGRWSYKWRDAKRCP